MDILIAVGSLFAAIYAIIPRDRQLDLQLRFSSVDLLVLIPGSLTIVYLQFYDFFETRGVTFARPWPIGITPSNTTYLVLLGMAIWLAFRVKFASLTAPKLANFRLLLEELYWADAFGELFSLLRKHRLRLFDIYYHRTFFLRHPMLRRLSPAVERGALDAQETICTIFLLPKFTASLARTRPYLAIDILSVWSREFTRYEFIDAFLRELVSEPTSIFYLEIADASRVVTDRYSISPRNRLLSYFLNDATLADEDRIYKPIGDFCLTYLDRLARDQNDPYCLAMDDFYEIGAWQSPLFVTLQFFDIMVREALFQGIESHMWLYYLPMFAEKFVRNSRIVDPLDVPDAEWPNRYAFLVYRAADILRGWIKAGTKRRLGILKSAKASEGSLAAASETEGAIPRAAILSLSQLLRHVLEAETVTLKFKAYILDVALAAYFDLKNAGTCEDYASRLQSLIASGGEYKGSSYKAYHAALIEAFGRNRTEYYIKQPGQLVSDLEEFLLAGGASEPPRWVAVGSPD
jgi:hypothetical protein